MLTPPKKHLRSAEKGLILQTITPAALLTRGFSICHLFRKDIDGGHYNVCIPVSGNAAIILCIITSQADKRRNYYRKQGNSNAIYSLVGIPDRALKFLTAPQSIVECNQAKIFNLSDLGLTLTRGEKIELHAADHDIKDDLKKRIVKGILQSTMVAPFVKSCLQTDWPSLCT